MSLNEKRNNDPTLFEPIKNENLVCNTCAYLLANKVSCCEYYDTKPVSVLKGGECENYHVQQDYYDGWEGLAEVMAKHSNVLHSPCAGCKNECGTHSCTIFGEKPHQYASALSKIPCPRRELSLETKIKGALYGFAIGDAMGATTEFMSDSEIREKYGVVKDILGGGWLKLEKGEVTDDTQMTLCVCKALEETIDLSDVSQTHNVNLYQKCCDYFVEWYNTNPKDIGNCCREIISTCKGYDFKEWVHKANNPNSLGNGSLMRSMPLVLAKQTLETTLTQGRLTHNNQTCDDCIEEYYIILKQCLDGELEKIPFGYKLKNPSGHVENTLSNAMHWFFETESVEEAIMGAVNHGGDADTIAAITGSLVGAYYGFYAIPFHWVNDLNPQTKELLDHYTQFFLSLYAENSPCNQQQTKESSMKKVITFKERVLELQQNILAKKDLIHNEENTKQALINPFLSLLGYDTQDPMEVEFEYHASFSFKNSDKVDYAIKVCDKPLFFLEAKKVTEDLSKHRAQLEYYMSTNNDVKIGILTNGLVYMFYAHYEKLKTMDSDPFFVFDFENMDDEKIDTLSLFRKQDFDLTKLLSKGEELWYYTKITAKLKDLLTKPSDDFIRLLAKDYSSTKITANALEKFKPIVNKAITTAVTDLTQETLVDETIAEKNKTITTTNTELKAFELVRKLLIKAGKDITNIDYKDTVSYFGIYNRNVNGWFVRFMLDQQPTSMMIRLEYTYAKEILSDLKIQPMNSKGSTKVFFDSLDDIEKLAPFIIKAFETVE